MNEFKINKSLIDETLENLKEDYLGFWIVYSVFKKYYEHLSDSDFLSIVKFHIEHLIDNNDLKLGVFIRKDEVENFEFVPWFKEDRTIIEQFDLAWGKLDYREPDIGEVCYFYINGI